jgi:16S rRNA G966 N2-methylase RsmD
MQTACYKNNTIHSVTSKDIILYNVFKNMIPPLTEEELAALEENLLSDGCIDPLIVWAEHHILLDGHNRKAICDRHGIDYKVHAISLPDREAAADWIDAHQLGRRNLTPAQMSLLRGRRYNRMKMKCGGNRRHGFVGADNHQPKTADRLAGEYGVSHATISRDAQYADAIDRLGLQRQAVRGKFPVSRQQVVQAARALPKNATDRQIRQACESVTQPCANDVSYASEWFTPPIYAQRAADVMGRIDLDPASCHAANQVVNAAQYYTADEDGLNQPWFGRVFLNPPYTRALIQPFCEKLVEQYRAGHVTQAVVLVNSATETRWFQALMSVASAVCFPARRVHFWHPDKSTTPMQGQAVLYLGDNTDGFTTAFKDMGNVCHIAH